jgi:transcriptional regulator with XRE-family HTH domain
MEREVFMDHYGVILRKLREINQLPIKQAAAKIERSAGWLSEIENGKGAARIHPQEFERIVAAYGGEPYRKQFGIWVAKQHKPDRSSQEISFSGAILKYLRKKAKLTIEEAAKRAALSKCYLSYLENGVRPFSLELRNRLLGIYGYRPSSFKNFTTEDKRAKNIPVRYKLEILLGQLDEQRLEQLFLAANSLKTNVNQ